MRATWAPRGETPVLVHHMNHWKRLSISAALCVRPDGSEATLVFALQPGSYNDETLIEFLGELHELLGGDKVTLVWDGPPSHRSRAMKTFLASQRHWLVVEALPGYAYDLNPVEQVWGNLKGTELANYAPTPSKRPPRTSTPASAASAARPNSAWLSSDMLDFDYEPDPRGITRRSLGAYGVRCRHTGHRSDTKLVPDPASR